MTGWRIGADENDPMPATGIVVVDLERGIAVLLVDEDRDTDGEGGEEEGGHARVVEGWGDGGGVDGGARRGKKLRRGGWHIARNVLKLRVERPLVSESPNVVAQLMDLEG